jgi:uncharacterized membrane protein YkvI
MLTFYKKYLLPGFVFQSIVIGGGYGTGRELVEFFLSQGPAGGYLGMLLSTVIWGLVLALSFELARVGRHYDYRTFLSALLGRGWIGFEVLYVLQVILTVAVVGSASGELSHEIFGSSRITGTVIVVALIAFLVYWGSALIERVFSVWSMALYVVYIIMIVMVWQGFQETIVSNATVWKKDSQWLLGGIQYAAYNLAALPAMLFALRHIETQREALSAGFLAGFIAMFPGVLVYTALLSQYPAIVNEAIPANFILGKLGHPGFQLFFQLILFGTFIETGTGMIHGFNERIAGVMEEHGHSMSHLRRLAVAGGLLVAAIVLAERFGLITLISRGYGLITWGFWILFLLPVLIIGSWRIMPKRVR